MGIIDSVTEPFCGTCNRMRITADGKLRTCLFSLGETDLRAPLRDGATDRGDRPDHRGLPSGVRSRPPDQPDRLREARAEMSQIGG